MGFREIFRLVAAAALLLAASGASAANTVRNVVLEAPAVSGARLQLELANTPRHQVSVLDNPRRVVIDLPGTVPARDLRLPKAAGPVRELRSGQQPDGTLRLVAVLDRNLDPKVTVKGNQLVVEIGSVPVVTAEPAAPKPVNAAHAPTDAGRDVIVAIDAGHGGKDGGARGANGTNEKDITLAVAHELARRVNAEPGMRAYLTRDSDQYVPLWDRIDRARRARADIFISIHADAIPDRKVSGSSVYVLSERGSSEAARQLAAAENAVDLKGGLALGQKDSALASVLMDLSQTASITNSMDAAERLLAQLDRVGTVRKTLVQQAGFVVLKSPDIPSVLVETAFISNPAEEKKLRTASYRAEIAAAIFTGVRDYFRQSPPDGTLFARQRAASRTASTVVPDSASP